MIRTSAFYAYRAGAVFDFEYYSQTHFPMVMALLQPYGAVRHEIERGLAMSDGRPAQYIAVGTIYFESVAGMQQGLAEQGAKIFDDVKNYTNLEPVIQVGELV